MPLSNIAFTLSPSGAALFLAGLAIGLAIGKATTQIAITASSYAAMLTYVLRNGRMAFQAEVAARHGVRVGLDGTHRTVPPATPATEHESVGRAVPGHSSSQAPTLAVVRGNSRSLTVCRSRRLRQTSLRLLTEQRAPSSAPAGQSGTSDERERLGSDPLSPVS